MSLPKLMKCINCGGNIIRVNLKYYSRELLCLDAIFILECLHCGREVEEEEERVSEKGKRD